MTKFDRSSEDYRNACRAVELEILSTRSEDPSLDARQEFYIQLLAENGLLKRGTRVVDLGGGMAWFIVVLSQMGLDATLIDDFGGGGGLDMDLSKQDRKFLDGFKNLGVKVYSQDLLHQPLPFPDQSVDVFTCFHSLEHWHHSPKKLFAEIQRVVRPKGCLVIATPNAVNLRKRVYAVLGINPFPSLNEWYKQEVFRGHVREPSIADLHRLLQWNGFRVVSTCGRNFIGQDSQALSFLPLSVNRGLARAAGTVLRWVPSLCSDIHVVGQRE